MLTLKETIEQRRSIRKFKPDPVAPEIVAELLEAARLAPSGSNSQPWRFKIVSDPDIKSRIAEAAFDQKFIARAPVVFVCCADIQGFIDGTISGIHDLGITGFVKNNVAEVILKRTEEMKSTPVDQLTPRIIFNVAIAVEHIVLRAVDLGLGTCWIGMFDTGKIKAMFGWSDNILPVVLLPVGYPGENPAPRKRKPVREILL